MGRILGIKQTEVDLLYRLIDGRTANPGFAERREPNTWLSDMFDFVLSDSVIEELGEEHGDCGY